MKHIRGLVSIPQALRQTFLPARALPRPQFLRYPPVQPHSQLRFASASRKAEPVHIKDENIPSNYIQIVNADNKLDPPVSLVSVLRSINRPDQFIIQVKPATAEDLPVCKIESQKEFYERQRAFVKAAKAKPPKVTVKQVELNWAIDAHDLSHRLKQLTSFLEKGRQVEVILLRKKHKRPPTPEEIKHVMDSVQQAIKDAGAGEVAPMEGQPGKRVMLTVKKKDS